MKKLFGRLAHRLASQSLRTKLFFSHLLVPLAGSAVFVAVVYFITPALLGEPADGLLETLRETYDAPVLYSLLVGGLAASAVATVVSVVASRRLTTPMRRMLASMGRVSSGRLGERVPVRADDELGALARGFNAMAGTLEEGERRRREFVSDVSHELHTPIFTLQGYMEGLTDGVVEPTEETWGAMYSQTERMRRLVDDLWQLSRAETGQLLLDVRAVPPVEAAKLTTRAMMPLYAAKGVELSSAVPQTVPRVLADADRLAQVLTNLLSNALRHTPAGGRVEVRAKARGGDVLFEVGDTGAGIAQEHLPRVFERFYRAEKSRSRSEDYGGSGLGLALCRALVGAMGGEIWAESAGPNEGATFFFTLPAATLVS